jgi:dinuclear metal center YbgI/SA1388 family protein
MTKIKDITNFLHGIAPARLQEDYDNAGLIVGENDTEVTGILISLDCTEAIIDEAIALGCNMVVAHHPIVFRGMKRFNNASYIERTIIKAIKNDIAIFAIHTNLDNVSHGVNHKICEKIGLKHTTILAPKSQMLKKITTYVPSDFVDKVADAMHEAGAGHIGKYKDCSFRVEGLGTFTPTEGSKPFIGLHGHKSIENEVRIEMIFPSYVQNNVVKAMKTAHPYEEVAYYLHTLDNDNQEIGAGMVGMLEEAMSTIDFLAMLKRNMELNVIKHTKILKEKVQKIAVCGGSGSFLTRNAISSGADVYISADYKYHEYFDADGQIMIVDIGHYESEKYTIDLLFDLISNNFRNFALHCTKNSTNPINYYY